MTTHALPIKPTREHDALTRHQSPHASSGSRRYFNPCCRVRVATTSGSSWGEHEIEGGAFGHWLLQGHHGSRQQQQQPPPPKPHATDSPDLQHSLPQPPSSCTRAVVVISSSTDSKRSKPWWKMRVPHTRRPNGKRGGDSDERRATGHQSPPGGGSSTKAPVRDGCSTLAVLSA